MKQKDLEPGFLQAFRLFVATRIVFWVVIGPILIVLQLARGETIQPEQITNMTLVDRLTLPNIGPILVVESSLLLLLLLPQVQYRLKNWFVPLTMILGLGPLLVGYYWWPSENPLQTPFVIFFFVMLVLIAWQYSFGWVVIYILGLTLYQGWMTSTMTGISLSIDIGWLVLQAFLMLLVGYMIVQLMSIQREQRTALAQAYERQAAVNIRLQRYAAAVEELSISRERNRLARELHDTLAHSLSAVTVQLEAVRSLWQVNPKSARDMLDKADDTARRGLTEARRALQALRATPLQDLGLVLALRELAETAAHRAGASVELYLPEQIGRDLPSTVEQGLYRIAQETLENIVRHAEATTIAVRLEQTARELVLSIKDDGLGIDKRSMVQPGSREENHLGIRGMQERASLIGGKLQIASNVGRGTEVRVSVPLGDQHVTFLGSAE